MRSLDRGTVRPLLFVAGCFGVAVLRCGGGAGGPPQDLIDGEVAGWTCNQEDPCGAVNYVAGLAETGVAHVNACCAGDAAPDGTMAHPYTSIGSALAAAKEGGTVAVAAGLYEESVKVDKPVVLIGAGSDRTTVHSTDDNATLHLSGVESVTISGFALSGTGGVGLFVENSKSVSLSDVAISGYQVGQSWHVGLGLYVADSTGVNAVGLDVSGNSAYGILFARSTGTVSGSVIRDNGTGCATAGVAVVDSSALTLGMMEAHADFAQAGVIDAGGCSVHDNKGVGLYVAQSMADVNGVDFSANLCGGIVVFGAPQEGAASSVTGSIVQAAGRFGLGLHGSSAVIAGNQFKDVTGVAGEYQGHCLVATQSLVEGVTVTIQDNQFDGCAGAGIFLDGALTAEVSGNQLGGLASAGIWAQGGVDASEIANNFLDGAGAAGIAVTDGSHALVVGNTVTASHDASMVDFDEGEVVTMADGILVSKIDAPGAVLIEKNTVTLAHRAGIIVDRTTEKSVAFGPGNIVAGNEAGGISLQKGAEGIADAQELDSLVQFDMEDVDPNGGDGDILLGKDFPVVTSMGSPASPQLCIPPACHDVTGSGL